jgi:hypothetical protein
MNKGVLKSIATKLMGGTLQGLALGAIDPMNKVVEQSMGTDPVAMIESIIGSRKPTQEEINRILQSNVI